MGCFMVKLLTLSYTFILSMFYREDIVTPFCKLTFINMVRQQFILNGNTSGKTRIYSQNEINILIYVDMLDYRN